MTISKLASILADHINKTTKVVDAASVKQTTSIARKLLEATPAPESGKVFLGNIVRFNKDVSFSWSYLDSPKRGRRKNRTVTVKIKDLVK